MALVTIKQSVPWAELSMNSGGMCFLCELEQLLRPPHHVQAWYEGCCCCVCVWLHRREVSCPPPPPWTATYHLLASHSAQQVWCVKRYGPVAACHTWTSAQTHKATNLTHFTGARCHRYHTRFLCSREGRESFTPHQSSDASSLFLSLSWRKCDSSCDDIVR